MKTPLYYNHIDLAPVACAGPLLAAELEALEAIAPAVGHPIAQPPPGALHDVDDGVQEAVRHS